MKMAEPEKSKQQSSVWKWVRAGGSKLGIFVAGVVFSSIIQYPVQVILANIWKISFGPITLPNPIFIIVTIIVVILCSVLFFYLGMLFILRGLFKLIEAFFNKDLWAEALKSLAEEQEKPKPTQEK